MQGYGHTKMCIVVLKKWNVQQKYWFWNTVCSFIIILSYLHVLPATSCNWWVVKQKDLLYHHKICSTIKCYVKNDPSRHETSSFWKEVAYESRFWYTGHSVIKKTTGSQLISFIICFGDIVIFSYCAENEVRVSLIENVYIKHLHELTWQLIQHCVVTGSLTYCLPLFPFYALWHKKTKFSVLSRF